MPIALPEALSGRHTRSAAPSRHYARRLADFAAALAPFARRRPPAPPASSFRFSFFFACASYRQAWQQDQIPSVHQVFLAQNKRTASENDYRFIARQFSQIATEIFSCRISSGYRD